MLEMGTLFNFFSTERLIYSNLPENFNSLEISPHSLRKNFDQRGSENIP